MPPTARPRPRLRRRTTADRPSTGWRWFGRRRPTCWRVAAWATVSTPARGPGAPLPAPRTTPRRPIHRPRAPRPRPSAGAPAHGRSGPGWPETSRSHPGCRVVVPERGRPAGSGSDIRGAPGAAIGRARARVDRAEGAPRGRAARAERACRAGAGRPERAPPPRAERSARPARSGSPRAAPSGPRHGRGSAGRTCLVPDLAGQGASRAPTRDTGCGRGHSGVPPVVRVAEPLTAARPPARVAAAPCAAPGRARPEPMAGAARPAPPADEPSRDDTAGRWPALPDDAEQQTWSPGLARLDPERARRLDREQRGL
jgi:hypothetical protein